MDDVSDHPTYAQNARPVGFPVSYRLDGQTLVVDSTRKVQNIDLALVREVRMTFEPKSFAMKVFRTRLELEGGRNVSFTSISWAGMVQARRQDAQYAAFVRALLTAICKASPGARFVAGRSFIGWLALAVLAFGTVIALALFTWRAFQSGAAGAALMGLAIGGFGIWQLEPMVRLNKPRTFTPDAPPADLLG
jgi:hypothetical protein